MGGVSRRPGGCSLRIARECGIEPRIGGPLSSLRTDCKPALSSVLGFISLSLYMVEIRVNVMSSDSPRVIRRNVQFNARLDGWLTIARPKGLGKRLLQSEIVRFSVLSNVHRTLLS